jgi:hypothetical protein
MDPVTVLADVALAIKLAKMAYDLGKDVYPFVKTAYEIMFKNKILTTDEREAMTKQETEWRAEIDAVIAEDDKATD